MTGRAKVELTSSPYAGGELKVDGRSGSSNVTRLLFPALSDIVLRRSFLSLFIVRLDGINGISWRVVSVEVFDRFDSFTLDFFTGSMPLASIVGAVVIISGAIL